MLTASTGPFCHEVTGPKCQLTAGGCVKCGGELRHPVQGVPQPCKVLREFLFYYVSDDMIVNNHFLALFSVHEAMRTGLVDEPWATGCVPEDFSYGVIRAVSYTHLISLSLNLTVVDKFIVKSVCKINVFSISI